MVRLLSSDFGSLKTTGTNPNGLGSLAARGKGTLAADETVWTFDQAVRGVGPTRRHGVSAGVARRLRGDPGAVL